MPRPEQPLGPGADPVVAFARDLRGLRASAGMPTYRELARWANYSASTLADAAAGRKLPSLTVTLAYVRACRGDTDSWEQRWHQVASELAGQARDTDAGPEPDPARQPKSPYPGLAAFQPEDADRFFGREDLVAEVVRRVTERRFLAVFGASGAGKSSLLRAGLVAAFTRSASGSSHRQACTEGAD